MSLTPEKWFSDLASECEKDLLRFLRRRVTNQAEAEDLAQEVYVRLLRVTDVGRIRSRRAFALRVAANVAHEWRMLARNRLPHSEEGLDRQVCERGDPAEEVSRTQEMECLSRALDSLSPICRAVLLLHKRDGLTLEETARFVGYSVPMVRRYLALGLKVCQEALAHAYGWK